MRLLSLKAKNIFSLGDVELVLDRQGLVLVTGYSRDEGTSNGAGKSSIANKAVLWGLFGQTAGGLRGDDVINRHVQETSFVQIRLEGVDGNTYTVLRGRNPNGLRLFNSDEVDISRRHEKETQKLINQILGRDLTTFLQTDFFGQGRDSSFLSLPPKEQKEVLESILPIEKLSEWCASARENRSEVEKLKSSVQSELDKLEGRLQEANNRCESAKTLLNKWDIDSKDRLTKAKKELMMLTKSRQSDINQLDICKDQLSKINLIRVEDDLSLLNPKKVQLQRDIHESSKRLDEFKQEKKSIEKEIKALEYVQVNKKCPTCHSNIGHGAVLNVRNDLENKLARAALDYAMEGESYKSMELTLSLTENQIERCNNEIKSHVALRLKIAELENSLSTITDLKNKVTQIRDEINPYIKEVESSTAALLTITSKAAKTRESLDELDKHSEILFFWASAFGKDIRNFMLDKACPFLQNRTAHHLQGLRNSQLKVTFNTTKLLKSGDEREDFNVNVASDTGGHGFDSLSGGEQQIVSFAVGMALADLAETQVEGKSKLLILDEPFVELDSSNQENLVNYLTSETTRETILMISNDSSLKSLISRNVHVEKQNGISRII